MNLIPHARAIEEDPELLAKGTVVVTRGGARLKYTATGFVNLSTGAVISPRVVSYPLRVEQPDSPEATIARVASVVLLAIVFSLIALKLLF